MTTLDEQVRRQFIIQNETWYAASLPRRDRVVAELRCGVDLVTAEGDPDGCIGEWFTEWIHLGGQLAAQVKVFAEAWQPLIDSGFHEIMAELSSTQYGVPDPTLEQVVEELRRRGWIDITPRVDPDAVEIPDAAHDAAFLQQVADTIPDAAGHDEVHAAAAYAAMRAGQPFDVAYLDRWLAELLKKHR